MQETEKELQEIAVKFGKIPTDLTKKKDIIDAGYLTEEEFNLLPIVPRSTEMLSATQWPKIGGRKTYPLSGALNEAEKRMYYDYKSQHKPGTGSVRASKPIDDTTKQNIEELRKFLKDKGADEALLAKFETVVPHQKVGLLEEMFGVSSVGMLQKVNLKYIMYRGPNGEFSKNPQPSGADFYALLDKDFMPKYTLEQVKVNVQKLLDKGIDVRNYIVDLK